MLVRVHAVSASIAMRLTQAKTQIKLLLSRIRRSLAETRADRTRVEAELFRGRYHLSSKNDDDLPLVR